MRRLVWLCTDGANVRVGTNACLVGLLRELQREVTGHAYFAAMHANCHRPDLAFKDALKKVHVFLDVLSDSLQQLAAYYNSSSACLKALRGIAAQLGTVVLKFGTLQDRRWVAFVYGALQSMRRSYPMVVCALHAKKPRDPDDQVKQQIVWYLITSYTWSWLHCISCLMS